MLRKIFNKFIPFRYPSPSEYNIPVLCYHSWQIGTGYSDDNHIAMENDLKVLAEHGFKILPIEELIQILHGRTSIQGLPHKKLVCITFDDGKRWDYFDSTREDNTTVKSFRRILIETQSLIPTEGKGSRALSFVIASPQARQQLSRAFEEPYDLWTDTWWHSSAKEAVVGVANHSWDHVHDALPKVRQAQNKKGSFFNIDNYEDAFVQVKESQKIVDEITKGKRIPVFGYPYGHVPPYLKDTFLPRFAKKIGLQGAFSTAGHSVTEETNIWDIPRFVCGHHWKTTDELLDIVNRKKGFGVTK